MNKACFSLAILALVLWSSLALADAISRGGALYKTCEPCHGVKGEGKQSLEAPSIAGQDVDYIIRQLGKFQQALRGYHAEDVAGQKMKPMSRHLENSDDIAAVAKYVSSLDHHIPEKTLQGGSVEKGVEAYATCIACHGVDAKGIKAMKAPSLLYLNDWYILSQINKFKKGLRGAKAADIEGGQMRAMAAGLKDDQAIKDVIAYIEILRER